ncbi:inovirus Gp2 family protein [Acinetobacter ursingii]|uniref:YagK/YfjJ domain-containing protein n=1 Tax=Acinetobacter ursingii TaxID=108980 RepID=UPI00244A174D|nr:inovirus-type Gp2 protein [Acinetobacter ursingii]MDH2018882.1 inovirus Gp2 family protein [Acinetobacter ursingii]MDH2071145.1 inovirus Gp2 family protein [Acinetobacter ursingii]
MTNSIAFSIEGQVMCIQYDESGLLIEIESFIQKLLRTDRKPRFFYQNFTDLLRRFNQIYNPDFVYSSLIDMFCILLYDYEFALHDKEGLYGLVADISFREWQSYFQKASHQHNQERCDHRYSEKLNAEKLDDRLSELLNAYSSLLVVRVDLNYRINVSIDQVERDLRVFRRQLDKIEIIDDRLLLVWALEQGCAQGGYHCHIALIFNGRQRSGAWSIAKEVGELWQDVTENHGNYFNCHDRGYLEQYERRGTTGVGMIFSRLRPQVKNMRKVMSYLAMPEKEQYLRVKTCTKMRTFGMSQRSFKNNLKYTSSR